MQSYQKHPNIRNFINTLSFDLHFSKPVFRHIEEFIDGAIQAGYRGKVTDIVNLSYSACHRTTYGKFLKKVSWNQEYIWRAIRKLSVNTIYKTANQNNLSLFVSMMILLPKRQSSRQRLKILLRKQTLSTHTWITKLSGDVK